MGHLILSPKFECQPKGSSFKTNQRQQNHYVCFASTNTIMLLSKSPKFSSLIPGHEHITEFIYINCKL